MIEGFRIRSLRTLVDERGSVVELMRNDWKELLHDDSIVQANLTITYPNMVRAWHRYARGQIDYFTVLSGSLKICIYDEVSGELDEVISTDSDLQVVRVPGHFWHGLKAIGCEPAWLLFFVNRLYDYATPDRVRRPWNDPGIVPKSINGNAQDPRVGKPWDWSLPPHK
jgi:dTDP-4-dehydrorhamnose 3,5-epimerase